MNSTDQSPIARKLGAFVALSKQEFSALDDLHKRRRTFVSGRDLVLQGQSGQSAFILASGWVCSYKLQRSGSRQIVDFQIPGDFLGLRSILFRTADHTIEPITKVEASEIHARDLLDAFSHTPRLATAVLWAASRDEAMVVEHLVGIGRRDAVERTAHFLLELGARLKLVGLATNEGYACPLSQDMLADALGLTAIHVNRVLRQLREDRIRLSVENRVLHLMIDTTELERRLSEQSTMDQPRFTRGYSRLYQEQIVQADQGCDFDFLRGLNS